ncbi:hypothetical protein OH709_00720 [Streptomyces cellulosae]|nr:hypothetical protein OHA60_34820 [Streptomyces cellulosae]WTC14517.1 hypothetical protein OH709_00720 [Streptomyces cellulosae]
MAWADRPPAPLQIRDVLAPRRHLLPQGAVLELGELAAVLGLGDCQGVLESYALDFGTELGDGPDVVPDDVAARPEWWRSTCLSVRQFSSDGSFTPVVCVLVLK